MESNNIYSPPLTSLCEGSPFASSNPILYLPRRTSDDSLDLTNRIVIEAVFRRFAGLNAPANFSNPNLNVVSASRKAKGNRTLTLAQTHAHNAGRRSSISSELSLVDDPEFVVPPGVTLKRHALSGSDYAFTSMSAVDWLEDFSSIHGIEEASTLCAHWVRMGLIGPVQGTSTLKAKAGEFIVRLRDQGEKDVSIHCRPALFTSLPLTSAYPTSSFSLEGRLPRVGQGDVPHRGCWGVVGLDQPVDDHAGVPAPARLVLDPTIVNVPQRAHGGREPATGSRPGVDSACELKQDADRLA